MDCQTLKLIFKFPNDTIIWWEGGSLSPNERFISYLKALRLISNGCIYYLIHVKDFNSDGPSLHFVLAVNEFFENSQ